LKTWTRDWESGLALTRALFDTAATTLGRAFQDDPFFGWLFPDPQVRSRGLSRLNRVPLEYGLRRGYAWQTDAGKGVAVWVPPGQAMTLGRIARSKSILVPLGFGPASMTGLIRANRAMDALHRRSVRGPHWYLVIVGVDPELQGRGRGSVLLDHGIAHADVSGAPCYLETSDPANIAFYERHGFVVVQEATLGKGGPIAYGMRRDALPVG
jgi:ribosomal protein S18 acetylase RimI-like enzyme